MKKQTDEQIDESIVNEVMSKTKDNHIGIDELADIIFKRKFKKAIDEAKKGMIKIEDVNKIIDDDFLLFAKEHINCNFKGENIVLMLEKLKQSIKKQGVKE